MHMPPNPFMAKAKKIRMDRSIGQSRLVDQTDAVSSEQAHVNCQMSNMMYRGWHKRLYVLLGSLAP